MDSESTTGVGIASCDTGQEDADATKPALESECSPVRTHGVSFPDKDWREHIERAKQARQEGRAARRGKPLTFRTKYRI